MKYTSALLVTEMVFCLSPAAGGEEERAWALKWSDPGKVRLLTDIHARLEQLHLQ